MKVVIQRKKNWLDVGKYYIKSNITIDKCKKEIVVYVILSLIICILFYNSLYPMILSALFFHFYLRKIKNRKHRELQNNIARDFNKFLIIFASYLRVSYSSENSFKYAYKDFTGEINDSCLNSHLYKIINKLELNISLEEAFLEFKKDMINKDIDIFVEVYITSIKNGGNLVEIVEDTCKILKRKIDARRDIDTMISSKALEFRIMCAIPFFIIIYIRMAFQKIFIPLYGNIFGITLMTVCLTLVLGSIYMGERILDVDL